MPYKVNVGDAIPTFKAKDHENFELESEDLIGSPFVIYFYPKDGTPNCTKEACSFRDNLDRLDDLDTIVIGVSSDGADSHQQFIEKNNLNFTLICDENNELARKFDVLQEKEVDGKKTIAVQRTTFVVDAEGIIHWIERPVNVEGHVDRVIQAVKEITA
jgi:thioredoxin-dependent peroxiredoxin